MIRRGVFLLVLVQLIIVDPFQGFAQEVVTLEEAYRSAMAESEQIGISRENLMQAEREIDRAKSFLYPSINTEASYLRRAEAKQGPFGVLLPEEQKQFNLTIDQPLYTGGRASAAYRSAKLGVRGGKARPQSDHRKYSLRCRPRLLRGAQGAA
ncbi:MAG: TolC family protein [Candidatus Manganitrophus sp.]|nr:MAG: TolC family protein [Candidatus Manganitrophus sp.]